MRNADSFINNKMEFDKKKKKFILIKYTFLVSFSFLFLLKRLSKSHKFTENIPTKFRKSPLFPLILLYVLPSPL